MDYGGAQKAARAMIVHCDTTQVKSVRIIEIPATVKDVTEGDANVRAGWNGLLGRTPCEESLVQVFSAQQRSHQADLCVGILRVRDDKCPVLFRSLVEIPRHIKLVRLATVRTAHQNRGEGERHHAHHVRFSSPTYSTSKSAERIVEVWPAESTAFSSARYAPATNPSIGSLRPTGITGFSE